MFYRISYIKFYSILFVFQIIMEKTIFLCFIGKSVGDECNDNPVRGTVERSQHVNLKNVMKTLDPILKIWILGCRRNVMKIVQMPMSNGSFRIGLTLWSLEMRWFVVNIDQNTELDTSHLIFAYILHISCQHTRRRKANLISGWSNQETYLKSTLFIHLSLIR